LEPRTKVPEILIFRFKSVVILVIYINRINKKNVCEVADYEDYNLVACLMYHFIFIGLVGPPEGFGNNPKRYITFLTDILFPPYYLIYFHSFSL